MRAGRPLHDRAFLLHGSKRDEILSLDEVKQYGIDSFADADYLRLYGMTATQWYASGIRLLGRTAVECTRDVLADRIGRDIAGVAALLAKDTRFTAIDPFAGSCNTLYWILRHLPSADGLAFEFDPRVFELTRRNIAHLDRRIELCRGDFLADLDGLNLPAGRALAVFVAPPWGMALDEAKGLDLSRTEPPITEVIERICRRYSDRKILFATQVYEKVDPASLAEAERCLEWSELRVYDSNIEGRNHGILLGTRGWTPG
jgi:hypothetical protein